MKTNLQVSFKLPISAVDSLRMLIGETLAECKAKSKLEVWKTLTEEQRAQVNARGVQCETLARYFDL